MHEDNVVVKEALKTAQDKLAKATAGNVVWPGIN